MKIEIPNWKLHDMIAYEAYARNEPRGKMLNALLKTQGKKLVIDTDKMEVRFEDSK